MSGNRAKLVRARPKAVEYLPEWRTCCPQMMEVRDSIGEVLLDMTDLSVHAEMPCRFCGSVEPERIAAPIAEGPLKGKRVTLESMDLDEGLASL